MSPTLGQAVILPRGLELAIPGRNGVEKTPRQAQGAEAPLPDRLYAETRPFRREHLVEIEGEVVGDERPVADVVPQPGPDDERILPVSLQDLGSMAVDPGCPGEIAAFWLRRWRNGGPDRSQPCIRWAASSTVWMGGVRPLVSMSMRTHSCLFFTYASPLVHSLIGPFAHEHGRITSNFLQTRAGTDVELGQLVLLAPKLSQSGNIR
jgi:hypothetical protein